MSESDHADPYPDPSAHEPAGGALPLVSVVVACPTSATGLTETLEALHRQTCKASWEAIIVATGAAQKTARTFVGVMATSGSWNIVPAPGKGGAGAHRNVGATAARGRHLVFCDAGDVPADSWLAEMVAALEQNEFIACRLDHSLLNPDWSRRMSGHMQASELIATRFLPYGASTSLGIRRRVFAEHGGFDETLASGDDMEFCWRLQLTGIRLRFAPNAVNHYRHRCALNAVLRQAFRSGRDDMRLVRRYRAAGHQLPLPAWFDVVRNMGHAAMRLPLAVGNRREFAIGLNRVGYLSGCIAGRLFTAARMSAVAAPDVALSCAAPAETTAGRPAT